jgi:hypothetical protein
MQPTIIAYFVWLQHASNDILTSLIFNQVLVLDTHLRNVIRKWHSRLTSRWLLVSALAAGLIFPTVIVFITWLIPDTNGNWVGSNIGVALGVAPSLFVLAYALVIAFLDIGIIIWGLSDLFSSTDIHLKPFHEDQAGGLGQIGHFAASLGYGLGIFGITLSIALIQKSGRLASDPLIIVATIIYIALAPLLFYLPLRAAHKAMLRYRNRLLKEISTEFDSVLQKLRVDLKDDSIDQVAIHDRLKQLNETRSLIMKFPTWPFNIDSARKFVGLVLSPLVPGVVSIIVELVTSLI